MADSQPNSQVVFSPAIPIPFILQPEERIRQLKIFLTTEFGEAQRVNVEALIKMYESGELGPRQLGDPPVYLVEGKRVDKDPWEDESVPSKAMKWREVCSRPSTDYLLLIYIDEIFRLCIVNSHSREPLRQIS